MVKKSLIIGIILVGMTIIPMLNAQIVENITIVKDFTTSIGDRDSHHKVLIEFGTATTCPSCPSHEFYVYQISGDYQIVTLACSHYEPSAGYTEAIKSRATELGLSAYPTSFFDGGFTFIIGGQYSVTNLQNAYDACQGRTVADVEITLFAIWNDDNTMKISIYVDNTGSKTYYGHLHIYVLEKDSGHRNWLNYNNEPFKDVLLGYAYNNDIRVNPRNTWYKTINDWTYSNISMDNVYVVAAVFDRLLGYSDEAAVAEPSKTGGGGNTPVPILTISSPKDGEIVNNTITISGTAHHPEGDGKLKWVLVKIDQNDWEYADGTVYWSHEWNTKTVEDGEHTIYAVCSDGKKSSAIYSTSIIVQNNKTEPEPDKIPDLECYGSLSWANVRPKSPVSGEFVIENMGDPESLLSWQIEKNPEWGDWAFNPNYGIDLSPEDGALKVNVTVVAPEENNNEFDGEVKVVNMDNISDYYIIPVSLSTPKNTPLIPFWQILKQLIEWFPIIEYLFRF